MSNVAKLKRAKASSAKDELIYVADRSRTVFNVSTGGTTETYIPVLKFLYGRKESRLILITGSGQGFDVSQSFLTSFTVIAEPEVQDVVLAKIRDNEYEKAKDIHQARNLLQ